MTNNNKNQNHHNNLQNNIGNEPQKHKKHDKGALNRYLIKGLTTTVAVMGAMIVLPELALAAGKFDINAGVAAATNPFIAGIAEHWGKGVLLTAGGAAIFGQGDARERALRAAIGAAAGGAVELGLLAMFS